MTELVKVERKYDKEVIKGLLQNYWEYQSFGQSFVDYIPDENSLWYIASIGEERVGYYSLREYLDDMYMFHLCVEAEYRPIKDKVLLEFKKVLKKEVPSNIKYLVATIPKNLSQSIVYAVENGWDLYNIYNDESIGKVFVMGIELDRFLEGIE